MPKTIDAEKELRADSLLLRNQILNLLEGIKQAIDSTDVNDKAGVLMDKFVVVFDKSSDEFERYKKLHGKRGAAVCDHSQWRFEKHGSRCPCGMLMIDPGD